MSEIKYNIMAKKKIWFFISLLIIIPGIISLGFQGLNLGIDFTGGALFHVSFDQSVETIEVREVLTQYGLEGSRIQQVSDKEYIIRTVVIDTHMADQLFKSLEEDIGQFEVLRNELVGPIIGKELTLKAIYALLIASVLMVIYISYRFELSFAIAAIIAILHDVFVTLSMFSIFQIEVDSAFVAAILTVIGYSINATIVIFDRIRENLKYRQRGSLEQLANTSVWQTLARSINTALTVVFVLVSMLLFGGETTKVFILAMLIGVVSGAYSSVLIASPVWLQIKELQKKRKQMAK